MVRIGSACWGILVVCLVSCGESGDNEPGPGPQPELDFIFNDIAIDGEPTQLTTFRFIPGTSEFLALTRPGDVLHYELDAAEGSAEKLGQFTIPDVHVQTDCGLLSLTFDPGYAENRILYIGYCVSQTDNVIRRFEFDPEEPDYANVADTAVDVIQIGDRRAFRSWHNVGSIQFDGDGNLLALFGDKRITSNGQDASNDLGALIRIKPSLDAPGFEVVAENPFVGDPERSDNLYAYGFRSPWQGFLDSKGRYWLGDVGSDEFEEVNLVTEPGQNFGWGDHEGPCEEDCEGLVDPIVYWDPEDEHPYLSDDPEAQVNAPRVAWVGLEYPQSPSDPYAGLLTGKVLFGDMCIGFVRTIEVDDEGEIISDEHLSHLENAAGWDVGPDQHIYAVTFGDRCTSDGDFGISRLVRLDGVPK